MDDMAPLQVLSTGSRVQPAIDPYVGIAVSIYSCVHM
jgi:hypothetical protein